MKIAYIAGPYRSRWGWPGRLINIWRARKAAIRYWRKGYAVICPHMNSAMMDGICADKRFLNGDIEMLKQSDCIVMIKGWRRSSGSSAEYKIALDRGIEIIDEDNDGKR